MVVNDKRNQHFDEDVRPILKEDITQIAHVYEQAFEEPWGEAALLDLLKGAGAFGFLIENDEIAIPKISEGHILAFVLARVIAGEGEILTIAVHPDFQGQGRAVKLLNAVHEAAKLRNASTLFLEVACDNRAAISLYEKLGYKCLSIRKNYYRRITGRVDAYNMSLDLTL